MRPRGREQLALRNVSFGTLHHLSTVSQAGSLPVAAFGHPGGLQPAATYFISPNHLTINHLRFGIDIATSGAEEGKMKKGLLILAASLMTLAPVSAPAAVRAFVTVGRPYYGAYYRPFWGPYWGPAYGRPYFAYPNSGEVKLDTKVKDAGVFINGAYAGTTHDNKT